MRYGTLMLSMVGATALGLAAGDAAGQDALGAGNVLDANLNVQGRTNPTQRPVDYRARNLVVTGNVAGGRGFRGTVGYTAAGDFRDETSADDFYSFRADSAFSTIDYVNSGTTFNQIRYGQQLGVIEYTREFGTSLGSAPSRVDYGLSAARDSQLNLSRIDADLESSRLADRAGSPRIVGGGRDGEGEVLFIRTSPLRGIEYTRYRNAELLYGFSAYDQIRTRADEAAGRDISGLGQPPSEPTFSLPGELVEPEDDGDAPSPDMVSALQVDRVPGEGSSTAAGSRVDMRVTDQSQADYQAILQRVAARYADNPRVTMDVDQDLLDTLGAEYDELKELLATRQAGDDAAATDDPMDALRPDTGPDLPGVLGGTDREQPDDDEDEADEDRPANISFQRDLSGLTEALRHGVSIDSLTDEQKTRYGELMGAAQEMLATGEYMFAERRFERAMRFKPGDPFAVAGMGHAQLGAGLYPTASLTLRRLLGARPEMIDVLYAEALLPNRPAMVQAANTLEDRIGDAIDVANNGFLLAYIGHQLDDADLIKAGVEAYETGAPDETLPALLRAIWIDGEPGPGEPE